MQMKTAGINNERDINTTLTEKYNHKINCESELFINEKRYITQIIDLFNIKSPLKHLLIPLIFTTFVVDEKGYSFLIM